MYFFSNLAVVLFCVFAGAQLEVDYNVLKPCHHQTDCFPWQECADCKYLTFRSDVKSEFRYCSDVSPRNEPRGLCANKYFSSPKGSEGYRDERFVCHCQRNVRPFPLSDSEPCGIDVDCLGSENRCTTCITNTATQAFHNFCTGEKNPDLDFHPSCENALCSCGQRRGKGETSAFNAQPPGVGDDGNIATTFYDNSWMPQPEVGAQPVASYDATNLDQTLFASANVVPLPLPLPLPLPDTQTGVEPSFKFDPAAVSEEDNLPIFT